MSRTYTTTGIILKRRDYQENDCLFCIYTKDFGKIEVVARGTKKISSKLKGYLEPFYLVKLMIAKGKFIDKLANCNTIKSYENLRADPSLLGFALINYLAEGTDGLISGHTSQSDKFNLLIETLNILEQEIAKDLQEKKERLLFISSIYFLKLLGLLGYQPEIHRCVLCHKGILLTKNIFDFSKGGLVCEDCKRVCLIEDYIRVSDGVIKVLQLAKEKSLDYFVTLPVEINDLKALNKVVEKLILVNVERPLKTLEFFRSI
ncbi:MAG: DNA repair protein RecO [Candidatus Parcubacteria bacterium]|nr:DNA repair protein RecO [Candidatus Parcubacteria bacterium]